MSDVTKDRKWREACGSRPAVLNDNDEVEIKRKLVGLLGKFKAKDFNWDLWVSWRIASTQPTPSQE